MKPGVVNTPVLLALRKQKQVGKGLGFQSPDWSQRVPPVGKLSASLVI